MRHPCTLQPGIFSLLVWRGAGCWKGVWIADPGRRQLLAVKRQPGGTEIWFTTGKVCERSLGHYKKQGTIAEWCMRHQYHHHSSLPHHQPLAPRHWLEEASQPPKTASFTQPECFPHQSFPWSWQPWRPCLLVPLSACVVRATRGGGAGQSSKLTEVWLKPQMCRGSGQVKTKSWNLPSWLTVHGVTPPLTTS